MLTLITTFKRATLTLVILVLAGCTTFTPKTKGGTASQGFVHSNDGVPVLKQTMQQPDNPDGVSKQTYKQITETISPDTGESVKKVTVEASTELGGAQLLDKILKASGSAEAAKRVVLCLILILSAFIAYKKGWPFVAAVFGIGAMAVTQFGMIAFFISYASAIGVYFAFHMGQLAVIKEGIESAATKAKDMLD